MRKLLILVLVLTSFRGAAQTAERYIVKPGEIPDKVLPAEAVYSFPEFKKGEVSFKAGGKSTQLLNYNCLLDEMQFLTVGGDTLTIAEPHNIVAIAVDSATYYFDKGYLRELDKQNGYKLALRERLVQSDTRKEAAYGTTSGTGSINSLQSVRMGNNVFSLEVRREVLFLKRHAFYLGNRYNRFVFANKKGFADVFPEKKNLIVSFIKEHKTDFSKLEDLQQLLEACARE